MLKYNSIILLALLLNLIACKQEEVNPVTPATTAEEVTDGTMSYVYRDVTYSSEAWNKKFKEVAAKAYIIQEENVAYVFDTEKEAEDFDQQFTRNQRLGGIPWAVGGALAGWNVSPSVSSKALNGYFQFKIRFYEHVGYKGAWIQYRRRGVLERTWSGGYRSNSFGINLPSHWRNRVSSIVIDEIVYPTRKVTVNSGIPGWGYSDSRQGRLKFYYCKTCSDAKRDSQRRYIYGSSEGRHVAYPDLHKWRGGLGFIGGIFGVHWNDKINVVRISAFQ